MKFHIEFDEKDIAKFIDKFGEDIVMKILPKIQEVNKALEKAKIDNMMELLEIITYDDKTKLDVDIHALNAIIDCTGTATLMDLVSCVATHEEEFRELITEDEHKELRADLLKYGWKKPISEKDIVDGRNGYYISKDSVVKLSEEQ